MSKKTLKTDFQNLQTCLIEIAENSHRLNRCDITLKTELLDHIDTRIQSLLKSINQILFLNKDYNYPNEYLPNKMFQYWAERVSTVFNYYELVHLKKLIEDSIEVKNKNFEYSNLFNKNGFELFNFIDERFESAITVKYTLILLFLRHKNYFKKSDTDFRNFVIKHCKLERHNIKFTRLADISILDEKYNKHEQQLTMLLKEFKHLNGIE